MARGPDRLSGWPRSWVDYLPWVVVVGTALLGWLLRDY